MIIRRPAVFAIFCWCTATAAAATTVAVDIGHGLADSGAVSARGRSEYSFNQVFASRLVDALQGRHLHVRKINFAGDVRALEARPQAAIGSNFFISVHHDSISEAYLKEWIWDGASQTYTDVKRGFGLFISSLNPDPAASLRCASAMGRGLRAAGFMPSDWHGRKHQPADALNGVWYYDNLVVLKRATQPAVLFEAGVIKHRDEELELLDPVRQERMADVLAASMAECMQAPVLQDEPIADCL